MNRTRFSVIGLLYLGILGNGLYAQEISAALSGIVTDPSGAAVVRASVTVISLDTGFRASTSSDSNGSYILPRLPVGNFRLTVDAGGFRQYNREPITLRAGDKPTVSVALQIGSSNESITVTAELTGIEGSESVMAQGLGNKQLSNLPLNGRAYIMLLQTTSGAIFTAPSFGAGNSWTMPNQFATMSDAYTIHGGRNGTNAYMMDGGASTQGAPYIPPPEAIEDMKVSSPTTDASQGLSGGGVINLTMRSGGNAYHGTLTHALRNAILTANQIQTNIAHASNPLASNQYQFNNMTYLLSGPVIKNKLFVTGNYDGFRWRSADSQITTVPTELQKAGDFSQTLNAQGQLIVIYDPTTTRQVGNVYVRDAYPLNKIPDALQSRLSKALAALIPAENYLAPGGNGIAHYTNYGVSPGLRQDYDSHFFKVDYLWNPKHRTSGSESKSKGDSWRTNSAFPTGSAFRGAMDPQDRQNFQATVDHVWTMNSSTMLDLRLSWDRYWTTSPLDSKQAWLKNPQAATIASLWKGIHGSNPDPNGMPGISISGFTAMGTAGGPTLSPREPITFSGDLSKTFGRHTIRFGTRITRYRSSNVAVGNWDGSFSFNGGFTQRDPLNSDTTSGNAFASYLLGYPAGGSTDITASTTTQYKQFAAYVQDDFRVNSKLTLNFGLRWDVQTAPTEMWDRVMAGFDPAVGYYLGDPLASNQTPNAKGGVVWADKAGRGGSGNRQAFPTKYRDFQPRTGVAYQVTRNFLVRAGYGISFLPASFGINTCCFSRTTNMLITAGGGVNSYIPGLPGMSTFENPFPTGLLQPFDASRGPKTQVGSSVSYTDPGYVIPRVHQFNIALARELPGKITAEASYVGSRTRRIAINPNGNALSLNDRLAGIANPTYLTASVPNPFYGAPELAGLNMAAATITRQQSLLPYPQFTDLTWGAGNTSGFSSYNGLEVRIIKRLSHGLTVNGTYTFSKTLSATGLQNDQSPYNTLLKQLDPNDHTHHLSISTLYNLPFGRDNSLGKNWSKPLDLAAGGWQINVVWEKPTGIPVSMPATPVSDPRLPAEQQTLSHYFKTCTLLASGARSNCATPDEPIIWVQPKPNEFLQSSTVFPNLRVPSRASLNATVMKSFGISERVKLSFRVEAFNVTNSRIYAAPATSLTSLTFGQVSTANQINFAREMQVVARLTF